ncbi:MAG: hypothetical protein N4A40_06290 [Tissierellales bacterium]|jgi:hypothetical protein|nr:hypothetical protein [Tissierellales bacterium]
MNKTKNTVFLIIVILAVLLIANKFINSGKNQITIASYDRWLSDRVDIFMGNRKEELKSDLLKFRSMPKEEQQELVDFLNNPNEIKEFFKNEIDSKISSSTYELSDSDKKDDVSILKVEDSISFSKNGIDIFRIRGSIRFRHQGSAIIDPPINGTIHVTKNLYPNLSYEMSPISLYTLSSTACATATVTLSLKDIDLNGYDIVFMGKSNEETDFEITAW